LRGGNDPAEEGGGGRVFAAADREDTSSRQIAASFVNDQIPGLERRESEKKHHYRMKIEVIMRFVLKCTLRYGIQEGNGVLT
jgi:hypothetical protein